MQIFKIKFQNCLVYSFFFVVVVVVVVTVSITKDARWTRSSTKNDAAATTPAATAPASAAAANSSVLATLLSRLRDAGVRLFLIDVGDIASASSTDWAARFLDPNVIVQHFGVFGEDADALDAALVRLLDVCAPTAAGIAAPCGSKVRVERGREDGVVVNVLVVMATSEDTLGGILKSKQVPFYMWKRILFRLYFRRGREGYSYRWTGNVVDDMGEVHLRAEAFDDFTISPTSKEEKIFFLPENVNLFIWRKEAAEFKKCRLDRNDTEIQRLDGINNTNAEDQKDDKWISKIELHPKGQRLSDNGTIENYARSMTVVKDLLAKVRIRPFLHGGTLLGWWRQCSILPDDNDVDFLGFHRVEAYPEMIRLEASRSDIEARYVGVTPKDPNLPEYNNNGFFFNYRISGVSLDIWLVAPGRPHGTDAYETGILSYDLTVRVCSADLHGFLVHVPCEDEKIVRRLQVLVGKNYMSPLDKDQYLPTEMKKKKESEEK